MRPPLYRKIDGHWYVLKRHAAKQMERAMLMAQINVAREMIDRQTLSVVRELVPVAEEIVIV